MPRFHHLKTEDFLHDVVGLIEDIEGIEATVPHSSIASEPHASAYASTTHPDRNEFTELTNIPRDLLLLVRWLSGEEVLTDLLSNLQSKFSDRLLRDFSIGDTRVAPSIVVRSEAELFGLAYPRFAFRFYLDEDGSFVNVRRKELYFTAIKQLVNSKSVVKYPDDITPDKLIGEISQATSVIADGLLVVPQRLRDSGYHVNTVNMWWDYGESEPGTVIQDKPGVPYVKHVTLGGGLCAQACCWMATLLLKDHAKAAHGLAEITYLADDPANKRIKLAGLKPGAIVRYLADGAGLSATWTGVLVPRKKEETLPKSMFQQHAGSDAEFLGDVLRTYVISGCPVIVNLDFTRMLSRQSDQKHTPILASNRFSDGEHETIADIFKPPEDIPKTDKPVRSQPHSVLVIGHRRVRDEDQFVINDPATFPFLTATAAQLLDAKLQLYASEDKPTDDDDVILFCPVCAPEVKWHPFHVSSAFTSNDGLKIGPKHANEWSAGIMQCMILIHRFADLVGKLTNLPSAPKIDDSLKRTYLPSVPRYDSELQTTTEFFLVQPDNLDVLPERLKESLKPLLDEAHSDSASPRPWPSWVWILWLKPQSSDDAETVWVWDATTRSPLSMSEYRDRRSKIDEFAMPVVSGDVSESLQTDVPESLQTDVEEFLKKIDESLVLMRSTATGKATASWETVYPRAGDHSDAAKKDSPAQRGSLQPGSDVGTSETSETKKPIWASLISSFAVLPNYITENWPYEHTRFVDIYAFMHGSTARLLRELLEKQGIELTNQQLLAIGSAVQMMAISVDGDLFTKTLTAIEPPIDRSAIDLLAKQIADGDAIKTVGNKLREQVYVNEEFKKFGARTAGYVTGFASFIPGISEKDGIRKLFATSAIEFLARLARQYVDTTGGHDATEANAPAYNNEGQFIELVCGSRIETIEYAESSNSDSGYDWFLNLRDDDEAQRNVVDSLREIVASLTMDAKNKKNVLGARNDPRRIVFALELEPGPLFVLRDWGTLKGLCKKIGADETIRDYVGVNLDISHWLLAGGDHHNVSGITSIADVKFETVVSDRIVHCHISGHSKLGHFGDLVVPANSENEDRWETCRDWLKFYQGLVQLRKPSDLPISGFVSVEIEVARSSEQVSRSVANLHALIESIA